MTKAALRRPAVFLDRDGTVLELVDYLDDPALVRLIPGAAEAVRRLRESGFACVVVSNQSGVGRGMFGIEAVHAVHDEMARLLALEGAALDAVYFCPALPGDDPERKPNPGMLLRAAREHALDVAASWMVGDHPDDLLAGRRAGCRGSILVRTGKPVAAGIDAAADLAEAADRILAERRGAASDRDGVRAASPAR
jgi:D-glycero-D-manno-heptose 1,7-bisphosphate phosphatase